VPSISNAHSMPNSSRLLPRPSMVVMITPSVLPISFLKPVVLAMVKMVALLIPHCSLLYLAVMAHRVCLPYTTNANSSDLLSSTFPNRPWPTTRRSRTVSSLPNSKFRPPKRPHRFLPLPLPPSLLRPSLLPVSSWSTVSNPAVVTNQLPLPKLFKSPYLICKLCSK